jgi:hypothetical protein
VLTLMLMMLVMLMLFIVFSPLYLKPVLSLYPTLFFVCSAVSEYRGWQVPPTAVF